MRPASPHEELLALKRGLEKYKQAKKRCTCSGCTDPLGLDPCVWERQNADA